MSEPIKDGGPAFPFKVPRSSPYWTGLTKREWFAGMALPKHSSLNISMTDEDIEELAKVTVKLCYAIADQMLKQSEVKP